MLQRLILISLGLALIPASVAHAEPQPNDALHQVYLSTLEEFGVAPNGGGAVSYLRQLHPSPERQQEASNLIDQLGNRKFHEREAATQQLLRLPNLPIEALAKAAEGSDPEVSWRARQVLQQAQGKSSQVIYAALRTIAAEKTAGAIPVLLEAMPLCRQPYLETAALDAIRASATADDRLALTTAMGSDVQDVRVAAAAGLANLLAKSEAERLYPWLTDANDVVALQFARALADQGDRRSLTALVRLLDSDDLQVRSEAVATLRGLTGQYLDYAAYESADRRRAAMKKWNTWVAGEGSSAKLTFPVPRQRSARGDLGGNTLVSTGSSNKVMEFDPAGKELWSYPISAWSAEKLTNGNVLIASYSGNKVVEVDENRKVVWEMSGMSAMTAKPLPGGNFLVSDFSGKRVVEVNRNKQVVWEHKTDQECFDSDRLPNGNTIFGCPNYVREVTSDHKTVREWKIEGRLNGFQSLPNGNILVANYGRSEVVELSPDGKQVWSFKEQQPCDVFRLSNGNTLISTYQRIIEIGPDDKLIKEICKSRYGSARR